MDWPQSGRRACVCVEIWPSQGLSRREEGKRGNLEMCKRKDYRAEEGPAAYNRFRLTLPVRVNLYLPVMAIDSTVRVVPAKSSGIAPVNSL